MTLNKTTLLMIGSGMVGVMAFAAWAGDTGEENVNLDQVPPAVRATILKEAQGVKITEIERETEDGKTIYEAEFLKDGRETEIKVAPDGTVLAREIEDEDEDEDITFDQIPAPARMALQKLARGAKILEAERENEHGVLIFEAEWSEGGAKHEAAVTADGTLLETEETIPLDKAPKAVRDAVAKYLGARAAVVVEKKIVLYEIEAKVDGREKELVILPTGRVIEEPDDADEDDDDDGYDND